MYFTENFKSKAAAKRARAEGKEERVKATSEFDRSGDGEFDIEGPWYPQPHTFYGKVTVKGGVVVSIK